MNYSTAEDWRDEGNYLEILYMNLDNATRNKLYKLTNTIKKIMRVKGRLNFLKTCKKTKTFPKFIVNKTKNMFEMFDKSFNGYKKFISIVNNFKYKLLDLEMTRNFAMLRKLIKEEDVCKGVLITHIQCPKIKEVVETYMRLYKKRLHTQFRKVYIKKSANIYKKQLNIHNYNTSGPLNSLNKNENWVVNLSNKVIPEEVSKFFTLSSKFNILKPINKTDKINLVTDIEYMLDNISASNKDKNKIRHECVNLLNKCDKVTGYKNIPIHTDFLLSEKINDYEKITKKFKKDNPDILIIKADKSNKTVLINKTEYYEKMENILNDTKVYKQIDYNPTTTLKNKVIKYTDNLIRKKFISKPDRIKIVNHNCVIPLIYGLVKLHKENKPLRPIVSACESPIQKLAKFLANDLKPFCDDNPFDVINAPHLKNNLKNLKILPNYKLLSFDIVNMFPNIPVDLAVKIINSNWEKIEKNTKIKNKDIFIEGIRLCCNSGYFQFNKKIYKQLYGIQMGNPLSIAISSLVMNHLLKEIILDTDIHIQFLYRYVDDLILCVKEDKIDKLLEQFNNKYINIEFTKEVEADSKITFLDMQLIRNIDNNLEFKWSQKTYHSNRMINFYSNHPISFKNNLLYNRTLSALLRTSPKYFKEVKNKLRNIFKENDYPLDLIEKQIKKAEKKVLYSKKDTKNNVNSDECKFNPALFKFNDDYFYEMQNKRKRIDSESIDVVEPKNKRIKKDEIKPKLTSNKRKRNNSSGRDSEDTNKKRKLIQTNMIQFLYRNTTNDAQNKHLTFQKKEFKILTNKDTSCSETNRFFTFKYHPNIANKIKLICKNFCRISWKYDHKIENYFSQIKDKIKPTNSKYNIYEISCSDCNSCYIGESSQILQKRIRQHAKSIDDNKNTTALTDHAIKMKHNFNFDDINILDKERNNLKRKIKENIYIIKNNKRAVNKKTDLKNLNCIFHRLLN